MIKTKYTHIVLRAEQYCHMYSSISSDLANVPRQNILKSLQTEVGEHFTDGPKGIGIQAKSCYRP